MQIVFLSDAKIVDIFHIFVDFFIMILCVGKNGGFDKLLINSVVVLEGPFGTLLVN